MKGNYCEIKLLLVFSGFLKDLNLSKPSHHQGSLLKQRIRINTMISIWPFSCINLLEPEKVKPPEIMYLLKRALCQKEKL